MTASLIRRARTFAVAGAVFLSATRAGAQNGRDFTPYVIPDRAAEVALARTAAPRNVSDSATILVLTRTGFVEASHGTNGFTCAVFRAFNGSTGDANFWSTKVRAPQCMNAAATRTMLPRTVKRTEWIMANVAPADVDARTKRAFASHEFSMPAAGAMAYMLSPEQYLVDDEPHRWMPHLMFFYDNSMPASAWGAGGPKAPLIDGSSNDSSTPITTLLIPLPQWSDGTSSSAH
ncbi:MAG: hypothetical protein ABI889_12635 [Gemmatimonadota bacterium]